MAASLIVKNSMIEDVFLVRKRPMWMWPTVFPFVVLYAMGLYMFYFPQEVWGHTEYLVYQAYIDFFHAILVPFVAFIHGFASLLTVWSLKCRVLALYEKLPLSKINEAEAVLVQTKFHKGSPAIVPLQRQTLPSIDNPAVKVKHVFFNFQERKWTLSGGKQFIKPTFPNKLSFEEYQDRRGFISMTEVHASTRAFGLNALPFHVPDFFTLFVDHVFAPFFVFQMFCVMLWCLDEYWMYSLFSGFMMCAMECTVVFQRINNMKMLAKMGSIPITDVVVFRSGQWTTIRSTDLLPLDRMVVPYNVAMPADAVLVEGSVVVNEAMLTGESTPQLKEQLEKGESRNLNPKADSRHVLYGGTQVLLSSGDTSIASVNVKNAAIAVVIKTGFETKQGKLLRTIIHSQSTINQNSMEAFGFIALLLVFALAASGYLLQRGLADPSKDKWKLFLHCVQIITSVVPTELPMELTLAVNNSLRALMSCKVFCTEPFRVPFAGKLDVCCFDKTGTLTTDEMLFTGVDMVDGQGVSKTVEEVHPNAELVLAGCHSLVHITNGEIAGDAMEKAAVSTLRYDCEKGDIVVKTDSGSKKTLQILERFPFNPVVRRMSTIIKTPNGRFVVVKGSPEGIRFLCNPQTVPENYDDTYNRYAADGLRVIALALKPIRGDFQGLTREGVECDLTFAGFALFNCPLKKDAAETIDTLTAGSHRCVVITGDNIQTALAVSKVVGVAPASRHLICRRVHEDEQPTNSSFPVYVFDSTGGKGEKWETAALRKEAYAPLQYHRSTPQQRQHEMSTKLDLCVDADGMDGTTFQLVVDAIADKVAVWARCNPAQKEAIVTRLKTCGFGVLMAGDGTNDMGGLKQAHVGVAVLNANAMEAPKETAKADDPAVATSGNDGEDLPPIPPGAKLLPKPVDPGPNAGFTVRMKYEMAVAQRKVQIQHFQKLHAAKQAKDALKASQPQPVAEKAPDLSSLMESAFNQDFDDDNTTMVKLGDASIAAPFTARSKRLMAVCDIVRMGRNSLVTTLQMYKILALNCLSSAYSMSVLHADGVKLGQSQMIISGVVISVCFLTMSRCQPTDRISSQRPVTRVFHPYMMCSIFGQFGLHLFSLMSSVALVKGIDSDGVILQAGEDAEADFKPTLLNSVVFMMSTLVTATTFAVNYRGEPFMKSIRQNRPMFYALIVLVGLVFYFAFEVDPETNEYFEIVKMPSEDFKQAFIQLLVVDLGGSFLIETVCRKLMTDG